MESLEESAIPPSFLANCQNWVPEPSGGLRARVGWLNASTTSAPATRTVKGIGIQRATAEFSSIALRRSTTGTAGSPTSFTFGSAGLAGNWYIAVVVVQNSANITATSTPAGWTKAVEVFNNVAATKVAVAIYYRDANGVTSSGNFTPSGGQAQVVVGEYSGLHASAPLDVTASNSGNTSSSFTADSGTTTITAQASELFVAGFGGYETASTATFASPSEGFAEVVESNGGSTAPTVVMLEKTVLAAATAHTTETLQGASRPWAGAIATFKAASTASVVYDNYVVANANSATEFQMYYLARNSLAAGTWTSLETISSLGNTTLPVSFANAAGSLVYTHPEFSVSRRMVGNGAFAITGSPSGNAIAFHRGRFYIADGTRLYFSGINDATSWDTTNDYIDVGQGDGDDIRDILAYAGQLIVAKKFSTWALQGSGPDNHQLDGPFPGGGYPGRCLCATPYGVVVAGEKRIYLWSGSSPEEVGKLLETTYSLSGSFVTTAYTDSVVYVQDQGSSYQFCFNVTNGTWWKEHVSTNPPLTLAADQERLLYGPSGATTISLLAYRSFPGTRARDVSMSEVFTARTAEMHRHGSDKKITPRHLYLTLKQRGTGSTGLTVTPYYDGVAQTELQPQGDVKTISPRSAAGVYRERIDLGKAQGVDAVQFVFSQTATTSDSNILDIEDVRFEYELEDAR